MKQETTVSARCITCRHRGEVVVYAGGNDPALFRCLRDENLVTLKSTCPEHEHGRE